MCKRLHDFIQIVLSGMFGDYGFTIFCYFRSKIFMNFQ